MASITRFVPFRSGFSDVVELQHRLNALFEGAAAAREEESSASFVPAVDVYEDEAKLVLKLEIPGVKQEDIDLRVENQKLTIKGQRRFEAEEKEQNFHRIERRFGSFTRSFTLPHTVDTNTTNASYQDGVLSITMAKKAEAKPRQIKVEIAGANAGAPKQAIEGEAAGQ